MNPPEFDAFKAQALARGFDEVVERQWAPGQQIEEHTHPFDADALVVAGEMWLTVNGLTQHLLPGGTFVISASTSHAERYGATGATYWVARKGSHQ